jgi:hypothetical protein
LAGARPALRGGSSGCSSARNGQTLQRLAGTIALSGVDRSAQPGGVLPPPCSNSCGLAEGTGWSPDAIADIWPKKFAPAHQRIGQQFPEPPK